MKHTKQSIIKVAQNRQVSAADRLQNLINIGLEALDAELGIISHIRDDVYTVMYSNNADLVGQKFVLGNTYCSITLDATDSRLMNVVAFENFGQSDYAKHPAYEAFNLNTYIGSPIKLLNETYGTLNFTQSDVRATDFTFEEKELVELLSSSVGYILHKQMKTGKL